MSALLDWERGAYFSSITLDQPVATLWRQVYRTEIQHRSNYSVYLVEIGNLENSSMRDMHAHDPNGGIKDANTMKPKILSLNPFDASFSISYCLRPVMRAVARGLCTNM